MGITKTRQGFTMVELLVVIAIIAVLVGILVPVFAVARRRGQEAVAISNMRQGVIALVLYAHDNDGWLPATRESAISAIPRGVQTDPRDTWSTSSIDMTKTPLVGSFAYRPLALTMDSRDDQAASEFRAHFLLDSPDQYRPLLLTIFCSDVTPKPFEGGHRPYNEADAPINPVSGVYQDGHHRKLRFSYQRGNVTVGFNWWGPFAIGDETPRSGL